MTGFIVLICGGILLALYVDRITGYGIAIFRSLHKDIDQPDSDDLDISLLVPVRNEAENLPDLILDIQIQLYPSAKLEILFINDHSDDASVEIIEKLSKKADNIRLLHLPEHLQGKKESINMGVREARGEWIIQTDADCRLLKGFVREHASAAIQNKQAFIAGPVGHEDSGELWDNIEALEFISLIGSSMGSFHTNRAVMCNGANLSYSKEFYLQNEEELKKTPSPSGDDMFLLIRAKKKGMDLKYLMSEEAIVTTRQTGSFRAFLQQRIRWGSKAKFYADFEMVYLTLLTFLCNGFILGSLIAALIDQSNFLFFGVFLLIKSFADLFLLYATAKHLGKLRLLWYFPLLALFYYFYLVLTGVLSLFAGYNWKGRNIKTASR